MQCFRTSVPLGQVWKQTREDSQTFCVFCAKEISTAVSVSYCPLWAQVGTIDNQALELKRDTVVFESVSILPILCQDRGEVTKVDKGTGCQKVRTDTGEELYSMFTSNIRLEKKSQQLSDFFRRRGVRVG